MNAVIEFLCDVCEEVIAKIANQNPADPRIEELLDAEASLILDTQP